MKRSGGYIRIYWPGHHRVGNDGYAKRADLVMEIKLGRDLKPEELVHHINGIRDDDRPENLQVMSSKAEHTRLHSTGSVHPSYREDLDTELIREKHRNGATYEELAAKYRCSPPAIRSRIPVEERHGRGEPREDLDTDLIRKEYRGGASSEELADKYKCSPATIRRRIPAEERRKSGQRKKDLDDELIREEYRGGASSEELAEKYKCNRQTIMNRIPAEERHGRGGLRRKETR